MLNTASMTSIANRYHFCVAATVLLVLGELCAAQASKWPGLASNTVGTACPGAPILSNITSTTRVLFKPGKTYKLEPGNFTMASTVSLAGGQSLCITGSADDSRPTVLLPPHIPASSNSSLRLHFLLQGGSLQLTNITLSGTLGGKTPGGGGVLVKSSNSSNSAVGGTLQASSLMTDRVTFRQASRLNLHTRSWEVMPTYVQCVCMHRMLPCNMPAMHMSDICQLLCVSFCQASCVMSTSRKHSVV
jgi:hypothetical protein